MRPGMLALALSLAVTPALASRVVVAQAEEPPVEVAPEAGPPAQAPPAEPPPPARPQQPPAAQPPAIAAPGGQWVYTQQYGWLWMPYGDPYTYVPPGGYGEPQMYVFYPTVGWTWVVAPWVWGFGPWPYFGVYGPWRFAWYGHGWWRYPYRWHYVPGPHGPYGPWRGPHRVAPAAPRLHAAPPRGVAGHAGRR